YAEAAEEATVCACESPAAGAPRRRFACAARRRGLRSRGLLSPRNPRFEPRAQCACPALVNRELGAEHDAVIVTRSASGNITFQQVMAHQRRVTLERLAPAAAPPRADNGLGAGRDRDMCPALPAERLLARQPQQVAARLPGRAAPHAPGRALGSPGLLEVPPSLDQVAHAHIEPEPPAIFAAPARILTQSPAFHQHRAFELDPLDRAVAHVALA